jgi:hypothetical protein
MPRSRKRRRKPKTTGVRIKLAPQAIEALLQQREAFREKFGRDWGPNDPIFFDPDADEPVQMSGVKMEAGVFEALRKSGAPPEIAYAYRKTGLLSLDTNTMGLWPKEHRKEWEAAVAEYRFIERARAEGGAKPEGWNTEIPELLASDFNEKDFAHVRACLHAMAPIEGSRPMKLVARIELAAAALATACAHAFDAAHGTGSPEKAEELYERAEELVLRRAREIYAQGPA